MTMYHSHLLINVGDNPDRPDWNITRRWLRNLYRVHQRLCMAFPSKVPASWADRISAYCAPYVRVCEHDRDLPGEPDTADVHHIRSDDTGFLFRIDYPVDLERGVRRPVIIVQSANPPDWYYAFGLNEDTVDDRGRPIGNAGFLLAAPPQRKRVSIDYEDNTLMLTCPDCPSQDYRIREGDLVRFRLRANPIYKKDGERHRLRIPDDAFNAGGKIRERAFIQAHEEWLQRKLGSAADELKIPTLVSGWSYGWRTKHEPQPKQRMQWWSVLFEGFFRVKDLAALKNLLESGVGPAKAFGFGLLSVAPVR
jgi:CRISPR-associated protein Cas6/Cse3/CasE subtype I-E